MYKDAKPFMLLNSSTFRQVQKTVSQSIHNWCLLWLKFEKLFVLMEVTHNNESVIFGLITENTRQVMTKQFAYG